MNIITRQEAIERGLTRYFTGKPCPQGHLSERYTRKSGCVECDSEGQKHRILVKNGLAEPKPKPRNLRQEALAAGERFYFTGKPCPYGHIAKRHVSSGCVECWPMHAAKDYKRHKAKRLAKMKKNQHKYADQRKEYAERNREYLAMKKREYNARPEVKEAMKERSRRWISENRERRREIANRYARSGKGLAKLRMRQKMIKMACPAWACHEMIETKYKERDMMTRLTGVLHHVDHDIPLQGENVCGLHVETNLRVILARDNLSKHNKFSGHLDA